MAPTRRPAFNVAGAFAVLAAIAGWRAITSLYALEPPKPMARPPVQRAAAPERHPADARPAAPEDYPVPPGIAPLPTQPQTQSGPGLLVAEPVVVGKDGGAGDLGAGCARWLFLMVGGHGELGRTPLWRTVERTRQEQGWGNLSLTLPQAAAIAPRLGLTHVALGRMERQGATLTLTYELRTVPEGQRVGQPLVLRGSERELVAGLPRLGTDMARALGIAQPRLPATVAETPAELRELCRVHPVAAGHDAARHRLQELRAAAGRDDSTADRIPRPVLAAFLYVVEASETGGFYPGFNPGPRLRGELPFNTLVLAECYRAFSRLKDAGNPVGGSTNTPQLDAVARVFPASYLVQSARMDEATYRGKHAAAAEAARAAAQIAPENPDAWLALASRRAEQANAVRQGRAWAALHPRDQEQCQTAYTEEREALEKVVQLQPQRVEGWQRLAIAAGVLGDAPRTVTALNRALELRPGDYRTLHWGTQVFQPKWLDEPERLAEVIRRAAAAAPQWQSEERVQMALSFREAGFADDAERLLDAGWERLSYQQAVAQQERTRQREAALQRRR